MKQAFLSGKKKWFFVLLYFSDLFSFALGAIIASKITHVGLTDPFYAKIILFSFLILMISYSSYNLYKDKRNLFDDTDAMKLMYSNLITFFVIVIFLLMFDPYDFFLTGVLALTLLVALGITNIARILLNKIIYYARKKGYDTKRTIYFGKMDEDLIKKLRDTNLGYRLVRVTDDLKTLKAHLDRIDIVFVKAESINDELLEIMIKHDKINWKIISSVLNLVIDPVSFDEFKDYPIINISNRDTTQSYALLKRVLDIIMSGMAMIVISPMFLAIAITIKITMPGPVFYKHERLGKKLKPFMLYKFRTMKVNADAEKTKLMTMNEVKGLFKMKDDPRITPFGKFLRRTCIDELGQLINIFKGDMSIVGPRPHLQSELHNFESWRRVRFNVKPGLTGLWQVNGRHELNFDKAVLYDIYYVKHMSLFLDFSIILKTIPAIVMNKGRF